MEYSQEGCWGYDLNRVVREDITEKVTAEQRGSEGGRELYLRIGQEQLRQGEQQCKDPGVEVCLVLKGNKVTGMAGAV